MRQAQPRFAARVHLLKDYFGIAEMAIDLGEHEGRQVSPHFEMSSLARNPMRRTSRPCVQGEDMNVGEICSRVVVVAESNTPVQQAAKLMRDQHIGALVVTEGSAEARRPIGIVTDRDMVVEVVAADVDYRMLTVGDIMSERPATINETAGLFEAIAQMRSGGVRRLVVADAMGRLLGIVAMDDLIPVLAEELSALAQAIRVEQRRETQRRP